MHGAVLALTLTLCPAWAGKVVILDDNGTFGYGGADSVQYADNVAAFFRGAPGGSFLGYGWSPAIPSFSAASLNTLTLVSIQPTLATLNLYSGVFLGYSDRYDTDFHAVLTAYVNGGGNVHLVAGDVGDPGWQAFLHPFGLEFGGLDGLEGYLGVTPEGSPHPVLSGVSVLGFNNGNQTLLYGPPGISRIVASVAGSPVIAVYEGAVPEPGAAILCAAGLLSIFLKKRR